MMDIMTIDNHKAKISYDSEIGLFRGEFIGLNGGADFYADSIEGKQSLQTYLEVCKEQGILQNKFTGTALTPLEICSLRQDLKQAHKKSKGFFAERAKRLKLT